MKKFLALVMVGVMTLGMTSMAASSPSAAAVKASVESSQDNSVAAAAAKENMSVGEYTNNVVVSTPGLENAAAMGVPQGVIVNGVKINYTIRLSKASKADVASALSLGKVLNVFKIKNNIFDKAQIAIYCKSVKAGQKVSVYQVVDGSWKKLTSSVRDEHIDVVLEGKGLVAVIAE